MSFSKEEEVVNATEVDLLIADGESTGTIIEPWKAWTMLLLAILLEVAGTISMKISDGYSKLIPSVLIYVFYVLSLAAFPIALQGIELSTAYAVWSGVGTVLTVAIGIIWFQDTVNVTKVVSLIVITLGCVAIRYADGVDEAAEQEEDQELDN